MVDIRDPESPQTVGSVDTPFYAVDVAASGTHAYVADCFSIQVIDITDPESPQIVGSVDTPDCANGVAVSGPHAYLAEGYVGLVILPAHCESSSSVTDESRGQLRLSVHPNPGWGRAFIELGTDGKGSVLLGLYDIAGRRVRRLYAGSLPAGRHQFLWDGEDESGRPVAAGIYLVRVLATEGTAAARLVVVR